MAHDFAGSLISYAVAGLWFSSWNTGDWAKTAVAGTRTHAVTNTDMNMGHLIFGDI